MYLPGAASVVVVVVAIGYRGSATCQRGSASLAQYLWPALRAGETP
jgi:hypothetical protein